jgi:hypothetical protein
MFESALDVALILRDLGFLLYAGPMVAFTVLVRMSSRIPHLAPWDVVRVYRSWGPGLGLSLGACVFGALVAKWLTDGAFSWPFDDAHRLSSIGWLTFLAMWISNIKLEIWTLEPTRKLDKNGQIADEAAFRAALGPLSRHMIVHSALIVAIVILARLSA